MDCTTLYYPGSSVSLRFQSDSLSLTPLENARLKYLAEQVCQTKQIGFIESGGIEHSYARFLDDEC